MCVNSLVLRGAAETARTIIGRRRSGREYMVWATQTAACARFIRREWPGVLPYLGGGDDDAEMREDPLIQDTMRRESLL